MDYLYEYTLLGTIVLQILKKQTKKKIINGINQEFLYSVVKYFNVGPNLII